MDVLQLRRELAVAAVRLQALQEAGREIDRLIDLEAARVRALRAEAELALQKVDAGAPAPTPPVSGSEPPVASEVVEA